MDHSEFRQTATSVLGGPYARLLMADLALSALNSRTATQALDDGVAPRDVWEAMCRELDLPEAARWAHRGTAQTGS